MRSASTLRSAAIAAALLTAVGMALLWPSGSQLPDIGFLGVSSRVYEAEVVNVGLGPCAGTTEADQITCYQVGFELREGPDLGELFRQDFPLSVSSPDFDVGDRVVLNAIDGAAPGFEYQWADRQRRGILTITAAVFAVAVVALGRLRGLAALAGLVATIFVVLGFVVPSLLDGNPPVGVAVVGAAGIAFLALYVTHGFGDMTTVALLGTLGALTITSALSALVVGVAEISGLATEESLYLAIVPGRIDVGGLVLAGIVLGALGALDDVTVTQASAVWELRAANPDSTVRDLVAAGMRVGRDHIASTVNTLVLAYAGASMPLLVLFVLSDQSLGAIANGEIVATEIIRTLVGSIGLVAAVPITTWLAATFADGSRGAHTPELVGER